jgi:hypothetical protein
LPDTWRSVIPGIRLFIPSVNLKSRLTGVGAGDTNSYLRDFCKQGYFPLDFNRFC